MLVLYCLDLDLWSHSFPLERGCCPLVPSWCAVVDPVILADGHSYERAAITRWLQSGKRTSPRTNARLRHTDVTPNHTLRGAIEQWRQQQKERRRQPDPGSGGDDSGGPQAAGSPEAG